MRFVSGRWWRTMGASTPRRPSAPSTSSAPPSATSANAGTGRRRDHRRRAGRRRPLLALPARPFPATAEVPRVVADNASVAFSATATRCRRGSWHDPPTSGTGSRSPTIDVVAPSGAMRRHPRPGAGGIRTLVRRREHKPSARGRRAGAPSRRRVRATRKRTGPRAERRSKRQPDCSGPIGREPRVDLSGLWRVGGGTMSESSTYQEIRFALAYLRLGAAAEALARGSSTPGTESSAIGVLGPTARGRGEGDRRSDAGPGWDASLSLPSRGRLDDFDFSAQPSVDKSLIERARPHSAS